MSHLLIIKDREGKELAKIPVQSGWSFSEVPLPKDKFKGPSTPTTSVDVGDSGKGKGRVGSN